MKKTSSFVCALCISMIIATISTAAQIVSSCSENNVIVIVTYPVIDPVGPGFGSQIVDQPKQLGTVIRRACYNVQDQQITGWFNEHPQGFYVHYGADEEEIPEILSAEYDIDPERDHVRTIVGQGESIMIMIYHRTSSTPHEKKGGMLAQQ